MRIIQRTEWLVGAALTAAAVCLHAVFLNHAGGLWRDECGIVRMAVLPTFKEMWSFLSIETCPVLFPTVLRAWSALGFGGTDYGFRVCGFLVGLGLLGAVWLNGRALTRRAPLVALGLLAANLTAVRWEDSLRAYGAGSVLMLVTVAAVWRFVESPRPGRWLAAAAAALLSAQCLFQNSFLILPVCLAGGAVCLWRKEGDQAIAALAIGVPAAAAYLPYLKMIHDRHVGWAMLEQTGFLPGFVWRNLSAALAPTMAWVKWLWIGLALLAAARGFRALRSGASPRDDEAAVTLFAATALTTGAVSFFLGLWSLGLLTQVWYYLPLLTFSAVCIDAASAGVARRWRVTRLLLACLLAGAPFSGAFAGAHCRQTNMDLIVAELNRRAAPEDLILVHPWYNGVSFGRYYAGAALWTTVPALEDHRFHRFDLLKVRMQMEHPIQPVLDQIASTLQSGHRVWLVGEIHLDQASPPDPRPAPYNPWGWFEFPYSRIWGAQVGYFIATHAGHWEAVASPSAACVNPLEDLPLAWVAGWRRGSWDGGSAPR